MRKLFIALFLILIFPMSAYALTEMANFTFGTLATAIADADSEDATFTVTNDANSGTFSTSNFITVVFSASCGSPSNCAAREIILIKSRSGTTFTIKSRNQESTTHTGNWPIGSKIAQVITKGKLEEYVPTTRTITATAPITIAGTTSADLSVDRTIAISAATVDAAGTVDTTTQSFAGAKTFTGNTAFNSTGTASYSFTSNKTIAQTAYAGNYWGRLINDGGTLASGGNAFMETFWHKSPTLTTCCTTSGEFRMTANDINGGQAFGLWAISTGPTTNTGDWGIVGLEVNTQEAYADSGYKETRTGKWSAGIQVVPEYGIDVSGRGADAGYNGNFGIYIGKSSNGGASAPKWHIPIAVEVDGTAPDGTSIFLGGGSDASNDPNYGILFKNYHEIGIDFSQATFADSVIKLADAQTIATTSTTISGTELSYLDGVTSSIQTQLGTKSPSASPTFTGTITAADIDISGTAPSFSMTDTTASAKSLKVVTDANVTNFYEKSGSAGLFNLDLANSRVGIGTTSPRTLLETACTAGSCIIQTGDVGTNAARGGLFIGTHNNDANALPNANDRLMGFLGASYDGATRAATAGLIMYAEENWVTNTSYPTYITFETAPSGSQTRVENVRIDGAGGTHLKSPEIFIDCNGSTDPYSYCTGANGSTLTWLQVSNTIINSYGRGEAQTVTLPAAAKGYSFVAIVGTQHNSAWKIQRAGSDTIIVDGTASKTYFQETNQAVGSMISCYTFKTGASAWTWKCRTESGTWATD